MRLSPHFFILSSNLVFFFCSHISSLLTWIQGIYLNKNACPRSGSLCVSHSLKENKRESVYLSEPSARGSLGRYTVAAVWQR